MDNTVLLGSVLTSVLISGAVNDENLRGGRQRSVRNTGFLK